MADNTQTSFLCSACLDFHNTTPILVGGDPYCEDCFRRGILPQFHDALRSETNYPIRYGSAILNMEDFATFFTPEFLAQWRARTAEYETPVRQRVYCNQAIAGPSDGGSSRISSASCDNFLGSRPQEEDRSQFMHCRACGGRTCGRCRLPLPAMTLRQAHRRHRCRPEEDDDAAFADMRRGVDYQVCPNSNCQARVQLRDGCNTVRCRYCQTHFCYLCGEQAHHNSNHWMIGNPCPRFGTLGDAHAIHDPELNEDEAAALHEAMAIIFGAMQAIDQAVLNVMSTPTGRLLIDDVNTLEHMHDLAAARFDLETRLAGRRQLITVRRLTRLLSNNLPMYIHRLVEMPPGMPAPDPYHSPSILQEVNVIRMMEGMLTAETFAAYPELRTILRTFWMAWEGVHDIVAMREARNSGQ